MRKIFNILLAMLLILPVLSMAAPCGMSMHQNEKTSMEHMENSSMPCPHHQQRNSGSCDGVMSLADCYHINMMTVADAGMSFHAMKSDIAPVAIQVAHPVEQIIFSETTPRAPPPIHAFSVTQPSLILTTQRFRV